MSVQISFTPRIKFIISNLTQNMELPPRFVTDAQKGTQEFLFKSILFEGIKYIISYLTQKRQRHFTSAELIQNWDDGTKEIRRFNDFVHITQTV